LPEEILAPAKPTAKEKAALAFDADGARGQVGEFRKELDRGRAAVRAKRYPAGITALQAALKIDPNHPSALAELGWAAFLSGDLELAERSTLRAIDSSVAKDRTRGAALYNLGRIHEERGDKNAAVTAYNRSLRLRTNGVVTERLAELESGGASAEENECEMTKIDGAPPLDLCAAFIADRGGPTEEIDAVACEERDVLVTEEAEDASGTRFGGERATRIALDLGDGARVATFGVTTHYVAGGSSATTYVALLFSDRWYVGELGSEFNPGVGYIGETVDVRSVTADDLIAGGRPEVIITSTLSYHDGDYGENTMESGEETIVSVVSVDADAPRWLASLKSSIVHEDGPMLEEEGSPEETSRSEQRVEVSYLRESGEVETKAVDGKEPSSRLGRYKLGEEPPLCPAALSFSGV